jgi:hypothetical protein
VLPAIRLVRMRDDIGQTDLCQPDVLNSSRLIDATQGSLRRQSVHELTDRSKRLEQYILAMDAGRRAQLDARTWHGVTAELTNHIDRGLRQNDHSELLVAIDPETKNIERTLGDSTAVVPRQDSLLSRRPGLLVNHSHFSPFPLTHLDILMAAGYNCGAVAATFLGGHSTLRPPKSGWSALTDSWSKQESLLHFQAKDIANSRDEFAAAHPNLSPDEVHRFTSNALLRSCLQIRANDFATQAYIHATDERDSLGAALRTEIDLWEAYWLTLLPGLLATYESDGVGNEAAIRRFVESETGFQSLREIRDTVWAMIFS